MDHVEEAVARLSGAWFVAVLLLIVAACNKRHVERTSEGRIPIVESEQRAVGSASKERMRKIAECVKSDSKVLRRRGVLGLALKEQDTERVVDAVVQDPELPCYLAIQIVGKAALPRLYHHLLDKETRDRALRGIALLGEPDDSARAALQSLDTQQPCDTALQGVLVLLRAAGSREEEAVAQLKHLESRCDEVFYSYPAFYQASVAFHSTRDWGLRVIHRHIERAIADMEAERYADWMEWLDSHIVGLVFAARTGLLRPDDITLLDRMGSLAESKVPGLELEPGMAMAKWLATRRSRSALDGALGHVGKGILDTRYATHSLWEWCEVLGDEILTTSDIPILIHRAADKQASLQVRVGAVRILGYLGSTDGRAHRTLAALLHSRQEPVRYEAAQAIGMCVEREGQHGKLCDVAKKRLNAEKSQRVIYQLTESIKVLEAF